VLYLLSLTSNAVVAFEYVLLRTHSGSESRKHSRSVVELEWYNFGNMSVNHEVMKIGNVECYPSIFEPQEVQIQLPFDGNLPLLLTSDQKDLLEQHVQAKMDEEVGNVALIQVPILIVSDQIPHPVQVKRLPFRDVDVLPKNRAIAEIGEAFTYWQSVNEILRDPHANVGFFELKNMTLHPLFILPDSRKFVCTVPISKHDGLLYGKSKYKSRIEYIDHAGDGNFCGTWRSPLSSVSFQTIDHDEEYVSYEDIGVSKQAVSDVFESARSVWVTRDREFAYILQSIITSQPNKLGPLIMSLIEKRDGIKAHHIVDAYYKNPCLNETEFYNELECLKHEVNNVFLERRFSSPTVKAVDTYCDTLDRMYLVASQYYQYSL